MDLTTLSLLFMKGDTSYLTIVIMILLPILNKVIVFLYDKLLHVYKNREYRSWTYITFSGFETIANGNNFYDYPKPFIAISYYAYKNNLCKDLRHIVVSRNSFDYYSERAARTDKKQNYLINRADNIKLKDDLYLDIKTIDDVMTSKDNKEDTKTTANTAKIVLIVKSKKKNINEIREFIDECIYEYDKFCDENNAGKLYHFIYKGKTTINPKLLFETSVLSDLIDKKNKNYQTFDHVFHEHKNKLLNDIKRLRDIEYYQKNGIKRKKGYLFYGHPGCGKTLSVIAMALEDNRHILEIPMSRIKTNAELEEILNINEINGIKIRKDELIILFDEIDTGTESVNKREFENGDSDSEKSEKPEKEQKILTTLIKAQECLNKKLDDELNLGTILSRTDGIGNYNGLILVATTNCKDKLSPALYRYGRLDPVYFDYARKIDIIEMIEEHYNVELTDEDKNLIPDRENKISQAYIRCLLDDCKIKEELINKIKFQPVDK